MEIRENFIDKNGILYPNIREIAFTRDNLFGNLGTLVNGTKREVNDYFAKKSAMQIDDETGKSGPGMSTAEMKAAVQAAVTLQRLRYQGTGIRSNSRLTEQEIKKYCVLTPDAEHFMKDAFASFGFSMRTYYKLLKVARTIADLDWAAANQAELCRMTAEEQVSAALMPEGVPGGPIEVRHIAEAVQYRALDRFYRTERGDR